MADTNVPLPLLPAHCDRRRAGNATQRVPRIKTLRRALQEEFAGRLSGTLRDWEQGRTKPDQPARAISKQL